MMNSTKKPEQSKQSDLLHLQAYAEESLNSSNSSQIIKREKYKNTELTIVTYNEKSMVSLGNYQLTDWQSEDECKKQIDEHDYKLILAIVQATVDFEKKIENKQEKLK